MRRLEFTWATTTRAYSDAAFVSGICRSQIMDRESLSPFRHGTWAALVSDFNSRSEPHFSAIVLHQRDSESPIRIVPFTALIFTARSMVIVRSDTGAPVSPLIWMVPP